MSWKRFLKAIGAGESIPVFENLKDESELPDDKVQELATEFLNERSGVFKSSDDYKKAIKDAGIVENKKFRKAIAATTKLNLSGEEIGKMTNDEFLEKLNGHLETEFDSRQNSKTSDIQKKLDAQIAENNKLKTDHEVKFKDFEKQISEAKGAYETKLKQDKVQGILKKPFTDPKRKWTNPDNDEIVVKAIISERGIKVNEEGKVYKGDDASPEKVLAADGITVIKDVDMLVDSIATERGLYQKSAPGANGAAPPTGPGFTPTPGLTPEQQNLVNHDLGLLEKMNNPASAKK